MKNNKRLSTKEAKNILFREGYKKEDLSMLSDKRIIDCAQTRLRIQKLTA